MPVINGSERYDGRDWMLLSVLNRPDGIEVSDGIYEGGGVGLIKVNASGHNEDLELVLYDTDAVKLAHALLDAAYRRVAATILPGALDEFGNLHDEPDDLHLAVQDWRDGGYAHESS